MLYVIKNKELGYRGDTMNSWSTTINEFMRKFGNKYFKNLHEETLKTGKKIYLFDQKHYKSWTEFLSDPSNYRDEKPLPLYITNFMEVVYTIGNFMLVPHSPVDFNQLRKDY